MPSGPPEEHAYWTAFGPTDGGDTNAIKFLEGKGWRLTTWWRWARPTLEHVVTEEEWRAINYLIMEWDFDGVAEGQLDLDEKRQRQIGSESFSVTGTATVTFRDDELLRTFLENEPKIEVRQRWRYKGILFRHKKGGLYMRLFEVMHSENLERLTIYVHLWPHTFGGWARPVAMFDDPERFRRLL